VKLIFDEVGIWTEVKLEIIQKYASAYSRILSTRTNPSFQHVYIDAFAGPGSHFSKDKRAFIPGSPQIALSIQPRFNEYFFIDINRAKIAELEKMALSRPDVHILEGNCNEKLLTDVFPHIKYEDYRRGLCLLDPYGLHLNWEVIKTAGHMKSIDIFLNFPIADANRNVLWKSPENVDPADIQRMNAYWGDESWRDVTYSRVDLWGEKHKSDNETLASAFRERLLEVAGFNFVPKPMPMKNSKNAIVYYLFFASQQKLADDIVVDIFNKY